MPPVDHSKADPYENACATWFLAEPGDRSEGRHERAVAGLKADPSRDVVFVVDFLGYPKFVSLTTGTRYGDRIEVAEQIHSRESDDGRKLIEGVERWQTTQKTA